MDLLPFFADIDLFCKAGMGLSLRPYQLAVARAVIRSVMARAGRSLAVMLPRQSGKNEVQAQVEAYLLLAFSQEGGELVKVSPTWRPQAENAMHRLESVLVDNLATRELWRKESVNTYCIGRARMTFLSGAPEANIVGATASLLLEVDEAQDVQIAKYDKEIAPMAASTNATRVFWGTAWAVTTLLAREVRAARSAQQRDGVQRAFVLGADEVAAQHPPYGLYVAEQVARFGRSHPTVKTQLFSEELEGEAGMFPPELVAKMIGRGASRSAPTEGAGPFALLIDVGGPDGGDPSVGGSLDNPRRDATALTVVQVNLSGLADPLLRAPIYRPVERRQWVGVSHADLYAAILALAERYRARQVVVDATGVGAGLASFLARALPGRVTPFLFNQSTKSRLGWDFLALVGAGRWQETPGGDGLNALFLRQLAFCRSEIIAGPGRTLRWGVPDGTRDPADGSLVHDDLIISAALAPLLDALPWSSPPALPNVIRGKDPLEEMKGY